MNLLINNDKINFLTYTLNSGKFETINYFDFFITPTFFNETLTLINLGLLGFVACFLIPDKYFNLLVLKLTLAGIFLIQFLYFINFVLIINFLKIYPFGLKLLINNLNLFIVQDFSYGLFFNPLNYCFILITIFLTFLSFILVITEKKINLTNNKKAIQNIFLINFFAINIFCTDNLIFFFFFLECTIFPMVFLLGFFWT